jgi:hypothetical protein
MIDISFRCRYGSNGTLLVLQKPTSALEVKVIYIVLLLRRSIVLLDGELVGVVLILSEETLGENGRVL